MTGKKIKFALKLKEGVEARNLQELKEAFDLNQIIAYFLDGKLETWLLDRYYNDLAEKIGTLEKTDPELRRKLCEIFEVEYEEDSLSVEEIEKRSQRIRKLKEITDDETIIRHVDKVAFSQEELADLLDSGQETIYLCGTGFHIPVNKKGIRYIGIETKLDITEEERENYEANDIELIDLFNDYSEETKDEYKKRIRFGEIFLDTDENQDSTQESNNCVPEGQAATVSTDNAAQEPVNVATDTEHDVVDELVEYQTKLKAAKQTCESDIILNMSEYAYLEMKALGFDYAVYKVMVRSADEKDKGDYRLNFSKAKRVLKVIEEYKHLPSVQGKFTDEDYANEMNFTLYKNSWGAVYDRLKTGMKQVVSEDSLNRFENTLKGLFGDILEEYGYDENGNKISGYAVNNNAPRTVNESAASYASTLTAPVVNRPVVTPPVQEESETSVPDKTESTDRPGITIRYNGKNVFLPLKKK